MQRYLIPKSKKIDDIVISKVNVPKPKRGQALVRMHAASLNYRDLAIVAGRYRLPASKQFGMVPLSDGAGEVVEVGADVTRVSQGDRVVITFVPGLVTGQSVLALGTGGVAVLAVQLAHAGGARVIVTSSSDKKLKKVLKVGASVGI